jgi:chaperonin GroEL (HSP60 family)
VCSFFDVFFKIIKWKNRNKQISMKITKCKAQFLVVCKSQFQYFVEAGAIAVRRVRKEDLRHVAKATGATVV